MGSLTHPLTLVGSGMATREELDAYIARGAKGVFWGNFIDETGQPLDGPLSGRLIGVSPEALRAIDVRMLVACGKSKREAIEAALRGGYATHIVTDEDTASWLLNAR